VSPNLPISKNRLFFLSNFEVMGCRPWHFSMFKNPVLTREKLEAAGRKSGQISTFLEDGARSHAVFENRSQNFWPFSEHQDWGMR
jgi:hypothetical protein